jgi:hypothetical protein
VSLEIGDVAIDGHSDGESVETRRPEVLVEGVGGIDVAPGHQQLAAFLEGSARGAGYHRLLLRMSFTGHKEVQKGECHESSHWRVSRYDVSQMPPSLVSGQWLR